jgi:hypothetical protein
VGPSVPAGRGKAILAVLGGGGAPATQAGHGAMPAPLRTASFLRSRFVLPAPRCVSANRRSQTKYAIPLRTGFALGFSDTLASLGYRTEARMTGYRTVRRRFSLILPVGRKPRFMLGRFRISIRGLGRWQRASVLQPTDPTRVEIDPAPPLAMVTRAMPQRRPDPSGARRPNARPIYMCKLCDFSTLRSASAAVKVASSRHSTDAGCRTDVNFNEITAGAANLCQRLE